MGITKTFVTRLIPVLAGSMLVLAALACDTPDQTPAVTGGVDDVVPVDSGSGGNDVIPQMPDDDNEAPQPAEPRIEDVDDLFDEIYDYIEDHFVDTSDLNYSRLAESALRGFVEGLGEDFSFYLTGDAYQLNREQLLAGANVDELFGEIYDYIQDNFADTAELDYNRLAESGLRGFVGGLEDDFSFYLNEDAYQRTQEQLAGSYEGIGAFVEAVETDGVETGEVLITGFLDGSLAPAAGLMVGDIVFAVDMVNILGLSLDEAISLVRGPAGSEVVLSVERGGITLDVEIERRRINTSQVISDVIEVDGSMFGVIRIPSFSSNLIEQLEDAVCGLLNGPDCSSFCRSNMCSAEGSLSGLIIDLRNNPGGFLHSTLDAANIFIDTSSNLPLIHRVDADGRVDSALPYSVNLNFPTMPPIVILVNGNSASGSEVFAGALRDYGRAVVSGELTFGKGSVNRTFELSNDAALQLTIERWYTPCGDPVHNTGITPDYDLLTPEEAARLILDKGTTSFPSAPLCDPDTELLSASTSN